MIGDFAEAVLLVLMKLGADKTTNEIHEALCEMFARDVSFGALFTTLDRMAKKNFVKMRKGKPLAERGGKARNYYSITSGGRQAAMEKRRSFPTSGEIALWGRGVVSYE